MRAVAFSECGDPEVLQVAQVDGPHPGPGHVRIAVRAASVNPFDVRVLSGSMSAPLKVSFPHVTGHDAAGVIDEVGAGVAEVTAGDAVLGLSVTGAAAEFTVLDDFVRRPAALSWEQASGLANIAETSARVFRELGDIEPGQILLVNGGSRRGRRDADGLQREPRAACACAVARKLILLPD